MFLMKQKIKSTNKESTFKISILTVHGEQSIL